MIRQIKFPSLEPWQKDPFKALADGRGKKKTYIIKAKRQVGKSILSELVLVYYALQFPGTDSIIIEPTNSQGRKIFKDIVAMMSESGTILHANGSLLEIEWTNGSTTVCKSAEQRENLRGFTVSGVLIYDEASSIQDEIFDVTAAYVNVHRAPILMVSTPKFKRGRFYETWTDEDSIRFDWARYDTSKFLSKEELEKQKGKVAPVIFVQDFLGEFADLRGSVFGDIEPCIIKEAQIDKTIPIDVMAIDWGTGQGADMTAITIWNSIRQMVYIEYFNNKDASATIDRIVDLARQWRPRQIVAEKNSIGNVFLDLLKKRVGGGVKVSAFVTTNDSKNKIINKLQLAFQNKEIGILGDPVLLTQLAAYEMQLTSTGKTTFNNGKGAEHDDCVISAAIGYDALGKGKICLV